MNQTVNSFCSLTDSKPAINQNICDAIINSTCEIQKQLTQTESEAVKSHLVSVMFPLGIRVHFCSCISFTAERPSFLLVARIDNETIIQSCLQICLTAVSSDCLFTVDLDS